MKPDQLLREGCESLDPVLRPFGFVRGEIYSGRGGSGGVSANCIYQCDDRSLELHFRHSLGLVTYQYGERSVSHVAYMAEVVGANRSNKYPGYSDNPLDAFTDLAYDLEHYAVDFLNGSCDKLHEAFLKEAEQKEREGEKFRAAAEGDTRLRQKARELFKKKDYKGVIKSLKSLKYPDQMTDSEIRMLEIARTRVKKWSDFWRKA